MQEILPRIHEFQAWYPTVTNSGSRLLVKMTSCNQHKSTYYCAHLIVRSQKLTCKGNLNLRNYTLIYASENSMGQVGSQGKRL